MPETRPRSLRPGSRACWWSALGLAALTGVAAAVAGWAERPPQASFIAAWASHLRTPLVPDNIAAENDRDALAATGYFPRNTFAAERNLSASQFYAELDRDAPRDAPRVIYLSGYAARDAGGQIVVMTKRFQPIAALGGLPLTGLLEKVDEVDRPTLLVLDLTWGVSDAAAGLLPTDIGRGVYQLLGARPNPNRLTLVSCSADEQPLEVLGLGQTAFGRLFSTALAGRADGHNPSRVTDGRVSAREVASYVGSRVAAWSREAGLAPQTPRLVAHGDLDFLLTISGTSTDEPTAPPEAAYPECLSEGWARRDEFVRVGARTIAPRLIGRMEHELLGAERRWRRGATPEATASRLRIHLPKLIHELQHALDRASLDQPLPSLAAARLAGAQPDEQLQSAWLALLDASSAAPTGAEGDAPRAAAAAEFRKATIDAAFVDLAAAGLEVLTRAPDRFVARAAVVRDELQRAGGGRQTLELADLAGLLSLAHQNPAIPDATHNEFMQATLLREVGWADPAASELAHSLLWEADAFNRSAWAAISLPGFASSADADELCRRAAERYRHAIGLQRVVAQAEQTRSTALDRLPDLLPLVRRRSSLEQEWLSAAELCRRLADALDERPAAKVVAWAAGVDAMAAELRDRLDSVAAPVSGDAVESLCEELTHDSTLLADAELMLKTRGLTAPQRSRLCIAASSAAQTQLATLGAIASRPPSHAEVLASHEEVSAQPTAAATAVREARFSLHLLRMMGLPGEKLASAITARDAEPSTDGPVRLQAEVRAALADARRRLDGGLPLVTQDRCGRVLPASEFIAAFDGHAMSPSGVCHEQRLAAWLASNTQRLRAAGADLGGREFATLAARRLAPDAATGRDLFGVEQLSPRPSAADRLVLASLSEQAPSQQLTLRLQDVAADAVRVQMLQPTGCLSVTQQAIAVGHDTTLRLSFRLRPDAQHADIAATSGVLLCLSDGARSRCVAVRTPLLAGASPVELYTELDGVRSSFTDDWRLAPSLQPQRVDWFVRNRAAAPRSVVVSLLAGSEFNAACDLPPFGEAKLALTPVSPPAEPAEPAEAAQVKVVVQDASSSQTLLTQVTRLSVRDPAEFVRVADASVGPDESGATVARLLVQRLPGAPETLSVAWRLSSPQLAGPIVAGGRLSGVLTPGAPSTLLSATLNPDWSDRPLVHAELDINGVRRVDLRSSDRPPFGAAAQLMRVDKPLVGLTAPAMVASGDPLKYRVLAAPTPPGARLQVSLADAGPHGAASAERLQTFDTARRGMVTVLPRPQDGGIVMHPTILPQAGAFDTAGVMGRRWLQATVFNELGAAIAEAKQLVVIDGDPASSVTLTPEATGVAGKPLRFAVQARDDLSGVTSVALFPGAPIEGRPPQGAKAATAVADPARPGVWVATLPMPAGAPIAQVTASVTNGVGLVRSRVIEVPLQSPEQAALGQIAGAVVEGARPQPGLTVELRDPDQKPVASASTNAQGKFLFQQVKPGKYLVWSVKEQSQRVGAAGVEVKAGATTTAELHLSL